MFRVIGGADRQAGRRKRKKVTGRRDAAMEVRIRAVCLSENGVVLRRFVAWLLR